MDQHAVLPPRTGCTVHGQSISHHRGQLYSLLLHRESEDNLEVLDFVTKSGRLYWRFLVLEWKKGRCWKTTKQTKKPFSGSFKVATKEETRTTLNCFKCKDRPTDVSFPLWEVSGHSQVTNSSDENKRCCFQHGLKTLAL